MEDILDFLLKNDFEIIDIQPCTEEEWNKLISKEKDDPFKKYKEGKPISLNINTNPNFNGLIREGKITYKFEKVKECEYQGHKYFLPMLNNSGKRVKGKTIVITDYEFLENEKRILIKNFTIEKRID